MSVVKPIYFVYGNHGDSPTQIEDYYFLLSDLISAATGQTLHTTLDPVPGHLNFLLEAFDQRSVEKVREAKQADAGTRFVCVATEFRTGATFNNFSGNAPRRARPVFRGKFLLSQESRDALKSKAPFVFYPAHLVYRSVVRVRARVESMPSHYDNDAYWIERFGWFKSVLPFVDRVWVVSPRQLEGYKSIVPSSSLTLLPVVPFSESGERSNEALAFPSTTDIDVLFTGTMTSHRKATLDALVEGGVRVTTGPFTLPAFVRESFVKRAKICLHLKQSREWQYTSIMRLHHLLMNGKYVIAEKADDSPLQTRFIEQVETENLPRVIRDRLKDPLTSQRGRTAREKYISATQEEREKFVQSFRSLLAGWNAAKAEKRMDVSP